MTYTKILELASFHAGDIFKAENSANCGCSSSNDD